MQDSPCAHNRNATRAPLKFLNSGGFAGPAAALRRLLDAVAAFPCEALLDTSPGGSMQPNDQIAFGRIWHSWRPNVTLDYTGRLFLPLYRFRRDALVPKDDGSGVRAAWERSEPLCFVHANGHKNFLGFPLERVARVTRHSKAREAALVLVCVLMLLMIVVPPALSWIYSW